MSFIIEVGADQRPASRHCFADDATTGSDIDADLVVPGAPAQWFEVASVANRLRLRPLAADCLVQGKSAPAGQWIDLKRSTVIRSGALQARVIPSRRPSAMLRSLSIESLPVAFGHVRGAFHRGRFLSPTTGLVVASVLAVGLLFIVAGSAVGRLTKAFASPANLPGPTSRISGHSEQPALVRPLRPLAPEQQVRNALSRVGIDGAVRVTQVDDRLVLSGSINPAELASVTRLAQTHSQGLAVDVRNTAPTTTDEAAPSVRLRSFGVQPAFIVLSDGRRIVPGDHVIDGWVLDSVSTSQTRLVKQGMHRTIANRVAP